MRLRVLNEADRDAVKAYLDRIPLGNGYDVEITRRKQTRTNRQNSLYWKWVSIISSETGNDAETIHKVLCKRFLGVDVVFVKGFEEKVARIRETHTLSKEDFSTYLDQVEAFCATELDLILPKPEDAYYEQFNQY